MTHPEFDAATVRALRELNPPPDYSMSEWADNERVLSKESSAEPGPWRTERFSAMREVMDEISNPVNEAIVLMFSAQCGKTEILNNTVGYYADQDPSSMLMIQYSLEMAETWSKDRLAPMIRDSPALRRVFSDVKARDSKSTILHKSFIGGQIAIAGANSPGSLASRPVRLVMFDEVDRYPASAGSEGDPVALGEERTETYYNRKIILASTPGNRETSRIEPAYRETDQRKYFVPCPECSHMQVLRWANFEFDSDAGTPAEVSRTVRYRCESCGCAIPPSKREHMVANGEWRATAAAQRRGAVGFHIWRAYSPWSSWQLIVERFMLAKGDKERLRVFTNTVLAETFEDDGIKVDGIDLYNRREQYDLVPDAAKVLTASMDQQDDRLEVLVQAWGAHEEQWSIDHVIIYGNPAQEDVWNRAAEQLQTFYTREDGSEMRPKITAVDTAGHHTTMAYKFCARHAHLGVVAIRGHSVPGQPIISRPKKLHRHNVQLYTVGVDVVKDMLFSRLQLDPGEQPAMHFPWRFDPEFFSQVTSEKRVVKYRRGVPYSTYIKTRPRNEALDLLVYNRAALNLLGMDLDTCDVALTTEGTASQAASTVIRPSSGFVRRPAGSFIKRRD